jgi:hypothetical protein
MIKDYATTVEELERAKRDPRVPGTKLDHGKARVGLVLLGFSRALLAVSEIGTYGAQTYSDDGWMSVPNGRQRYTDAMLRHLLAEGRHGENLDPGSGLLHSAHVAWNALARLDLQLRELEHVHVEKTDTVR